MEASEAMVTDEDRKAAGAVAVLPEMRELILAGRADHHAEPFAAHRIAALEEAAGVADRVCPPIIEDDFDAGLESASDRIATAIRALKEKNDGRHD